MIFKAVEHQVSTHDDSAQSGIARPLNPLEDMSDLKKIRRRFQIINQERLNRTRDSLRQSQKDFLDALPLLFHVNHPMFPGYVSQNAPCGISDYQPTKEGIHAVQRFTKKNKFERPLKHAVYSIFVMGSIGTIAHSRKSDLDFWLCYNPELNPEEYSDLLKKAVKIEVWALKEIELEIHFFPMDADKFRSGEVGKLDSENSGSTQHHLLLDEFYRTGVFLVGRYPAWWLIPPECEGDYDECLQSLLRRRFIAADDVIDFGGLAHIPPEEFYGAGLWQVYKGIDSPYKSLLKILLIEIYADEYPRSDLLCLRYKKDVYTGVTDLNKLDPYVMLMEKLGNYLQKRIDILEDASAEKQKELDRLELVRRCFYLKINVTLSAIGKADSIPAWRRESMESLVTGWGWDNAQISDIYSHDHWKGHRVLREKRLLIKELGGSYTILSGFGNRYAKDSSLVSDDDRTILGRKLFSAIDASPQKIDIIYRGIVKDLSETHITIELGKDDWFLSLRNPAKEGKEDEIKKSTSVVTLLAWCHFNKIIGAGTMIALKKRTSFLDMKEVNSVLRCLRDFAPNGSVPYSKPEDFGKPAQIIRTMLLINIGVDPMAAHNRSGVDFISNRGDVLSYGNASFNLAVTADLLVVTSWQEAFNYSHQDKHVLVNSLCDYLRLNISKEEVPLPPLPNVHSFSSTHSISLVRRISDLYKDVREFFLGVVMVDPDENTKNTKPQEQAQEGYRIKRMFRYLLICGNSFYLLYPGKKRNPDSGKEEDALLYIHHESFPDVLRILAEPKPLFTETRIDRYALSNSPFPLMYKTNQKNMVQLFYQVTGKVVEIYVLDEHGSLFYQKTLFHDDKTLINHFHQFFVYSLGDRIASTKSVADRETSAAAENTQPDPTDAPRIGILFYRIMAGDSGFSLAEKPYSNEYGRYFSVRVNSKVEGNSTSYVFSCDEKEFSSAQYGNTLFQEVANYILLRRRSGERYPAYITSVDLPPNACVNRSANEVQIIDFLRYKKSIEEKLNEKIGVDSV